MNNPFLVLESRLNRIEELLLDLKYPSTTPTPAPADDFLSVKEAAEFLSIAQQTIYQNIKRIPHQKRFGRLYFKRLELIAYLEQGTSAQKKGGKL